jgi:hypothetical protein
VADRPGPQEDDRSDFQELEAAAEEFRARVLRLAPEEAKCT